MDRYRESAGSRSTRPNAAAWHLAVSRAGRDTIARYTGDSDRLRVLPVGVRSGDFQSRCAGRPKTDQILFVGFLNTTKGVDILLPAMAALRCRRPASTRLVLVGGAFYRNTRLQADQLKQLAVDLGLADVVTSADCSRRKPWRR